MSFHLSSIMRKVIMSISGMFLVLFVTLHLAINMSALVSRNVYETACRFMSENAFVQIMVPVLAAGFAVHIFMAIWLTLKNQKSRPVKYAVPSKADVSWSAKNMLALGIIVFGGLVLHLSHFWIKMQLPHWVGEVGENPYDLLAATFSWLPNVLLYTLWIFALTFHLSHGIWSMYQSVGASNSRWLPRLKLIAIIYSHLLMVGFLTVIYYFYIRSFLL